MEEYDISADAPLNKVLTVLRDSRLFISEAESGDVTHFRTDNGSFVLVLEEEGVAWLNVCERQNDGLQFIVFDELKKHLRTRILRDSRDATDPGEQYMPETNLDDTLQRCYVNADHGGEAMLLRFIDFNKLKKHFESDFGSIVEHEACSEDEIQSSSLVDYSKKEACLTAGKM